MSNEQIPAEEIKRIEEDAHIAAMESTLLETPFDLYMKGAAAEFLRHLNSKQSGLKVGDKVVLDVEHNNSSVVTIRATAKYYSTVTDGKSDWEVMANRLSAIVSAASTPTQLEEKTNKRIVTNDNYFVAQCVKCGFKGSSEEWKGGGQIADTGDHADYYCPVCGQIDCEEADDDIYIEQRDLLLARIDELSTALDSVQWDLHMAPKSTPTVEPGNNNDKK